MDDEPFARLLRDAGLVLAPQFGDNGVDARLRHEGGLPGIPRATGRGSDACRSGWWRDRRARGALAPPGDRLPLREDASHTRDETRAGGDAVRPAVGGPRRSGARRAASTDARGG